MHDFSPIKENIIQYLEYKGISQYQFYKDTGVTRGILGMKTGLSEDNIKKVLACYGDINPLWLITGNGDMLIAEKSYDMISKPGVIYESCQNCREKQKQIEDLQRTIDILLSETQKDRDLIRELIQNIDRGINKQSRSA